MGVGVAFRHIDEIYKRTLLDAHVPRKGDVAEIIRDHHKSETGLEVLVVNDPHRSEQYCAECGQVVVGMFVEVDSPELRRRAPGWAPYFYPIEWLRRVR